MTPAEPAPDARALLREATERNYRWPPGVSGFGAALRVFDGERALDGLVEAPSAQDVRLELPGAAPDDLRWATTELRSLIGHRLHRSFEQGDGRYGIRFGPEDTHPFGRLILLDGDPNRSSYRVADGMLRMAHRHAGPRHFTLAVHDAAEAGAAQYIARHYTVHHFSSATGALIRADAYTDEYAEVGGVWLPRLRRVVSAEGSALRVRELALRELSAIRDAAPPPELVDTLRAKRGPAEG